MEISEILADNQGGLQDEDMQSPGWIELHNETAAAVNLAGWHLTDNAALPARWTFPAVTVPANGYLVVFASGKDRALAGSPLHTNFKLKEDGEYLALTNPANETVSGFVPSFPALRRNISYSQTTGVSTTALVPPGTPARYRVPADGAAGNGWIQADFDDTAWTVTATPVGFDANGGGGGAPLLSIDFNDREFGTDTTQSGFSPFVIGSTGGVAATQTGGITRTLGDYSVTLSNTGADPYNDRNRATPTDSATFTTQRLLRDFVFSQDQTGTSGLDVAIASLTPNQACRVTVWSFDSGSSDGNHISDWFANGLLVKDNYSFNGITLPASDGTARFSFDTSADATGKLVIGGRRDASSRTFGVFLNALQISPLGIGGVIATDLSAPMKDHSSSVYLRTPFTVADPAAVTGLRLKVRYDDGFTAYINGQPVASRNAPASLAWDSAASASRTVAEAMTLEEIVIPVTAGLLRQGGNMLAVQGLNASAADADFLFDASLEAVGAPAAIPRYFSVPTPGAANNAGFPGLVTDTKFTVDRGFYTEPVTTAISCDTPGAVIRYTLDGSTPTATTGTVYSGPVTVSKTTSLRAAAFVPGFIPSSVDTQTYVFPALTVTQAATQPGWPTTWGTDSEVTTGSVPANYGMDQRVVNSTITGYSTMEALNAIPTMSMALPPGDFLGSNGIYQNPKSTGDAWKRACSLEFIDPKNLEPPFAENCMVEIHGNSSRRPFRVQKHSFRISFTSDAGSSKLEYPLFPGSKVREFNKLVLRACFTDAWCLVSWDAGRYRPDDATYLRDVWMKRTHEAMGSLAPDSRYCHLYINGLYWGMYNVSERIDEEYVASHLGGLETDWEVVPDFADADPSATSPWKLMFNAANAGLSTPAAYANIQKWLNPADFADYYILHQYGEAEDWPHHNGYAYRSKIIPNDQYKWITWDQEIALNNHGVDRVSANATNTTTDRTPGKLLNQLRANAEFRLLFADRAHKLLHNGGPLDIVPSQERWMNISTWIDQAIVAESARWGDTAEETPYGNTGTSRPGVPLKPFYNREADWLPTVKSVRDTWIPSLHNTANTYATVRRLQAASLYPASTAPPPDFTPFGAISTTNVNLTMASTAGQIYYTLDGTDPREAITGNPLGTAYTIPVTLTGTTTVKARTRNGTTWSPLTEAQYIIGVPASAVNLAVSEIFHNPADAAGVEFIELLNKTGSTLDLTSARFSAGITYTFPAGTLLAPGQRLVLTGNQFTGKLDNNGENLTLLAADDSVIFTLNYKNTAPWPSGADGEGRSLVLMAPGLNPADPASWRPSAVNGGTPGAVDSTVFTGTPGADTDADGANDFLEYALGTGVMDPASLPQITGAFVNGDFLVTFTRAAAADDAEVAPEFSADFPAWNSALTLQSRTPAGSGLLTEVWKSPAPLPSRLFIRLRANTR
ncbi:MAG: lamin tail domain-containing protein [Verrucomicrobiota bacterium]